MNSAKSVWAGIILCLVLIMGLGVWMKYSLPRIGYVKSAKVVDEYLGMKEARNLYKEKMSKWRSNIDTLESDYQNSLNRFNIEYASLTKKEKEARQDLLKKQEMNMRQYVSSLDQKANEEDQRMTEGVINQINSYIKEFGEQHHYDLVLGITVQGNILYGKDAIDVTDQVLKGLNESYRKNPQVK